MGKISKRVLGAAVGKVGDVAFRKWRGMDVVQTYASENPSKTEKQVIQRELMSDVTGIMKGFLCPLRLGFKHNATKTTEWAQGIKKNFPILVNGTFQPTAYPSIQLSDGGLKAVRITAGYVAGPSPHIAVAWDYSAINPCGKNNPDDNVVIVVSRIDAGTLMWEQHLSTTALRNTQIANVNIPAGWSTDIDDYAVYAFCYNDSPEVNDASPTTCNISPEPTTYNVTLRARTPGTAIFTIDGEPATHGTPVAFPEDTEITIAAFPEEGYTFVKWEMQDGTTITNETSFEAGVTADVVYYAVTEEA